MLYKFIVSFRNKLRSKITRIDFTDQIKFWESAVGDWDEIQATCSGYSTEEIIDKVKNSTLKVLRGEAVYERDSVVFDKKEYSTGMLSALLLICQTRENLNVIDFGGSLGSSYFQNRELLINVKVDWRIVEQPNFVSVGLENFSTDELSFFHTIKEAMTEFKPHIFIFSSVLQYLKNLDMLDELNKMDIEYILIDRTSFNYLQKPVIVKQNVPKEIYSASYPMYVFNKTQLLSRFSTYQVVYEFKSYCEPNEYYVDDETIIQWSGFLLKKSR